VCCIGGLIAVAVRNRVGLEFFGWAPAGEYPDAALLQAYGADLVSLERRWVTTLRILY